MSIYKQFACILPGLLGRMPRTNWESPVTPSSTSRRRTHGWPVRPTDAGQGIRSQTGTDDADRCQGHRLPVKSGSYRLLRDYVTWFWDLILLNMWYFRIKLSIEVIKGQISPNDLSKTGMLRINNTQDWKMFKCTKKVNYKLIQRISQITGLLVLSRIILARRLATCLSIGYKILIIPKKVLFAVHICWFERGSWYWK